MQASATAPIHFDPSAKPSIGATWTAAETLQARLDAEKAGWFEACDQGGDIREQAEADRDAKFDRLFGLEDAVLAGPINSRFDAAAKLKAVAVWAHRGEKADGGDVRALEQVIAWLVSN
jgi:hypothetical protein